MPKKTIAKIQVKAPVKKPSKPLPVPVKNPSKPKEVLDNGLPYYPPALSSGFPDNTQEEEIFRRKINQAFTDLHSISSQNVSREAALDKYIRDCLGAIAAVAALRVVYRSPLDALDDFMRNVKASTEGSRELSTQVQGFAKIVLERVESSRALRDIFKTETNKTKRDAAAAELRLRGLLK